MAARAIPGADPTCKLSALRERVRQCGSLLVAYSGGVDSSFLLAVAAQTIPGQVVALTTLSPTNPHEDVRLAREIARQLGVQHLEIRANELAIEGYAANPVNRCYFCKRNLYQICKREAAARRIEEISDGVNQDDLGDYRPGLEAAREAGVRHLLAESQLSKPEIRVLSRELGLPTWDRPASPCLSSRFPYGTEITEERLKMVAAAETLLRELGFREVRVRYHEGSARIEVAPDELARAVAHPIRSRIASGLRDLGFRFVALDLEGFRSGNLNRDLGSAGS